MDSRRDFLKKASAAAAAYAAHGGSPAFSSELSLPLGLQLYSVREQLPADFAGTLRMIGELGYREVEAAGFFERSVEEVKAALAGANLRCVSSHYGYGKLAQNFDQILEYNVTLGVRYLVCASQAHRNPVAQARQDFYSLDDWHFLAEKLNGFGERVSRAGLRFAYHNHSKEFVPTESLMPYRELMRLTDPGHVDMEMDCGWVVAAGGNPVEYLKEYHSRITMLHVKDFLRPTSKQVDSDHYTVTELGRGFIDYAPIFSQAAKAKRVQHVFVEQEAFDIPVRESLAEDAAYMHRTSLPPSPR